MDQIAQAALSSAVTPFLLKTDDNPLGMEGSVFDEMVARLEADHPGYLREFAKDFFNVGKGRAPVSDGILAWYLQLAMQASAKATLDCARAWSQTDFRPDTVAFTIPTLFPTAPRM